MELFNKYFIAAFTITLFCTYAFSQEELHNAIDSGDIETAQKMVKKGEVEEIYCGKLNESDALKVYEKLFKSNPDESFAACPSQFTYSYGTKVCSNARTKNACTEVITYLLNESETGNTKALDFLSDVTNAALKVRAFSKPVKQPVDTAIWIPCPQKKGRENCQEECYAQAQKINDIIREGSCETMPMRYVDTTLNIMVPSPMYEKLRQGLQQGYWKVPKSNAIKYSKIMQSSAKILQIPDSLIININYVNNWAKKHKADSSALPGTELFRFCESWPNAVDSILAFNELEARCPVFEIFEDSRDAQKYKVKNINGTNWFVQNMNYAIEDNSMCYDREDENCKTYGRLYTQEASIVACPEGTHLATDSDWKMLEIYAGGASLAAEKLRSNGSDDYAFTAMFGGYANKNGISTILGEGAYFWTSDDIGDGRSVARSMFSTDKDISTIQVDKRFYLSVRCILDNNANVTDSTKVDSAKIAE